MPSTLLSWHCWRFSFLTAVSASEMRAEIGDNECYGGWCPGEGMTPLSQWFSFRCDTLIDRIKTIIYCGGLR